MGLDATVYCTCFRDGNLKTPPPAHVDVYVDDDGSLNCLNSDFETQIEFDAWCFDQACSHENGHLVGHRIGNLSLVASLRSELSARPNDFPILISKVVYSGSHSGDFLDRQTVNEMRPELDRLAQLPCANPDNRQRVDHFLHLMRDLVSASDQTGNPIAF